MAEEEQELQTCLNAESAKCAQIGLAAASIRDETDTE